MPPRPRTPGRGGTPGTPGTPNGIGSAQTSTTQTAQLGRPGSGGSGTQPTRSAADLQRDLDPTQRPGETPQQAADRVEAAQAELDLRRATDVYQGLGDDPPRLNIGENDTTHGGSGAHTVERHGADVPLGRSDAPAGDRTIEGRIHGDPPWNRPENWSYRWMDDSTMNRTVNDYVRANWDNIRSDLALNGEFSTTFDAGHRTGEGFYNEGMYGAGPRSAHYAQTSHVTLRLRLIPGTPPQFMVVTAFPSGLP